MYIAGIGTSTRRSQLRTAVTRSGVRDTTVAAKSPSRAESQGSAKITELRF